MPQDFSRQNLQGYPFKGQNLTGANFSHADIRGANFTNTTLIGANFSHAEAGVQGGWTAGLVITSLILVIISGFLISVIAGSVAGIVLTLGELPITFCVVVMLITFAVFAIFTSRQGLGAAFGALAAALPVTIAVTLGMSLVGGLGGLVPRGGAFAVATAFVGGVVGAITGIMTVAGAIAIAIAVTVAGTVCVAGAIVVAVAGMGSMAVGTAGSIAMTMAQSGGKLFSWDGLIAVNKIMAEFQTGTIAPTEALAKIFALAGAGAGTAMAVGMIVVAVPTSVLGSYIAWRTLAGDARYAFIRRIAVTWATAVGTNFRGANLTDANFTQANLRSTDLRRTNLTRTCWFRAKKLDQAQIDGTYLEESQIRQLVLTKEGQNRNFDGQNLQSLNLQGANLANARFIGANLCQASLQEADLSGAILVRSQLDRANLTDACLTGACIENWGVTKTTQLKGVLCKYVYLKFINENKLHVFPSDGEFKEGEFSRLVNSLLDNFDLYNNQDVNPKAAIIVLQTLSEEYQEPIEIVGLENRDNGIVFKIKTSDSIKAEQIQKIYQSRYNQTLNLSLLENATYFSPHYEALETKIAQLIEEVKQPRTTTIKYLYNEGLVITGGNVKANVNQTIIQNPLPHGVQINVNDSEMLVLGNVSSIVANAINQLPDYTQLNQPSIKKLLTQLQIAIKITSELTPQEKVEALEQVKLLAESGKNPQDVVMQKQVRTAVRVLRGTISELPTATNLVREGDRLLRAIAKFFSFTT